ncbi:hypothetical protein RUND412_011021 [Rhizina undulata]
MTLDTYRVKGQTQLRVSTSAAQARRLQEVVLETLNPEHRVARNYDLNLQSLLHLQISGLQGHVQRQEDGINALVAENQHLLTECQAAELKLLLRKQRLIQISTKASEVSDCRIQEHDTAGGQHRRNIILIVDLTGDSGEAGEDKEAPRVDTEDEPDIELSPEFYN